MNELRRKSLPWNKETVYALGLYRFIGRSLGIWPLKSNYFGSRIRLLVIAILQITLGYNLIAEIGRDNISIFDAMSSIGVLASNIISMLKISVIHLNQEKLHCILESAVNDWSVIRDDESRKIMCIHAHRGRIVCMFQLSTVYLGTASVFVLGLPTLKESTEWITDDDNFTVDQSKNQPMESGSIVVNTQILLSLGLSVLQLLQLLSVGSCNIGTDSLFFGIGMHLCAQFKLLQNDIARLDGHECEKKSKQQFATLIKRHYHLVRLANSVEDVFHLIILGQLAASGLHITLMGIQILFALRDHYYSILIYTPSGIILLLLQLCIYSFVGDRLTAQIKEVGNASFNCSWYNVSSSFAKDVLFVIMRSNDPFYLTAGKVFRMNLEGFTRIIKTIASFFSFLKITIIG